MQAFNTALSWAARKGNRAIVKILLDKNANTEAKNTEVIWWCIILVKNKAENWWGSLD